MERHTRCMVYASYDDGRQTNITSMIPERDAKDFKNGMDKQLYDGGISDEIVAFAVKCWSLEGPDPLTAARKENE